MNELLQYLNSLGFVEIDQMEDFGERVSYMKYMHRVNPEKRKHVFNDKKLNFSGKTYEGNFHQYMWVVFAPWDPDNFLEVVMREYLVKYNSRRPKGFIDEEESFRKGYTAPRLGLARSLDDVKSFLS